jgi:hypothetical protein
MLALHGLPCPHTPLSDPLRVRGPYQPDTPAAPGTVNCFLIPQAAPGQVQEDPFQVWLLGFQAGQLGL